MFGDIPVLNMAVYAGGETFFLPVTIFKTSTGPSPRPPKFFKRINTENSRSYFWSKRSIKKGIKVGIQANKLSTSATDLVAIHLRLRTEFSPVILRNLLQATE